MPPLPLNGLDRYEPPLEPRGGEEDRSEPLDELESVGDDEAGGIE